MKTKEIETSISQKNIEGPDHQFSPFLYNRIANQFIDQAKVYRDGGNMSDLQATLDSYCSIAHDEKIEPASSVSSMAARDCWRINVLTVTKSSPSPGISFVHTIQHAAEISRITAADSAHGHSKSSHDELGASKVLKDVHISAQLMEDFLELARDNTTKDLETCGVLGAFLTEDTFYVTTLIIPKQETTSSSCQALNEEEIFAIQNEQSLFPVGWIHTHPSQSCFMSSIDLHTQYSYQELWIIQAN